MQKGDEASGIGYQCTAFEYVVIRQLSTRYVYEQKEGHLTISICIAQCTSLYRSYMSCAYKIVKHHSLSPQSRAVSLA